METKKFLLLLIAFFQLAVLTAQDDYVRTVARPGDTMESLLRWYNLDGYSCNVRQFYELNKLKQGAGLIANKVYFLPIRYYKYNGKSIRTTINDTDINKALRIKAYNEEIQKMGFMAVSFVETRILWVPYHELKCPGERPVESGQPAISTTAPPAKPSKTNFSIFGKNNPVKMVDNALAGAVYYVVSGHGGPDSGAVGTRNGKNLCEDEYAYDVSLRLAKNLLEHGATVYMITRDKDGIRSGEHLPCDHDETCWENKTIPRSQKARLQQRADAVNGLFEYHKNTAKIQRAVMIHVDSRNKSQQTDLFLYHHPLSPGGRDVANILQNTVRKKYKKYQPNRGYGGTVTARDLHMLRETKPAAVYVELGNIRHSLDQQRIVKASNRQALADWLYDGFVVDYKKNN